jgi:hypothetical protein
VVRPHTTPDEDDVNLSDADFTPVKVRGYGDLSLQKEVYAITLSGQEQATNESP